MLTTRMSSRSLFARSPTETLVGHLTNNPGWCTDCDNVYLMQHAWTSGSSAVTGRSHHLSEMDFGRAARLMGDSRLANAVAFCNATDNLPDRCDAPFGLCRLFSRPAFPQSSRLGRARFGR